MANRKILYLVITLTALQLVGCGKMNIQLNEIDDVEEKPIQLHIVTSYGGEDANRIDFERVVSDFEFQTDIEVIDGSSTVNEGWKEKVMSDFKTGSEPDVLFYFTGSDADQLIEHNKVVSLDEIREVFPEYGSNMDDNLLPEATIDGQNYTIPVNGFWEAMYVNKIVLEEAGVEVPGKDYTWQQFLIDCEKIKMAGYTPIAASLEEVPHYWFEFAVFNNGNLSNHLDVPMEAMDAAGIKWVKALEDIKELYDKNYFPTNTLTCTDAEATSMMINNKAAFLIDGSWKINWFKDKINMEDFTVTYVPAKGERKTTDIIGGMSMGYYITRKAWNDEAIREAAVQFVMAMTTDEVVSQFGPTAVNGLVEGVIPSEDLSALELDAIEMLKGCTGVVGATQDGLAGDVRSDLFSQIHSVVEGNVTAEDALQEVLGIKYKVTN